MKFIIKNTVLILGLLLGGLTTPLSVSAAGAPVEDLTQQDDNSGYTVATQGIEGTTPSFQSIEEQPMQHPTPPSSARPSIPTSSLSVDLATRIDRLQTEVDKLRGQVEVQEYTIKRLTEQLRVHYQDLDQRLQNQKSVSKKLTATMPAPKAIAKPAQPIAKTPTNENLNDTDADENAGAEINNSAGFGPAPITSAPDPQSEKKEYDAAIALLKKQDYVRATTQLQRYLRDYPTGKYTASSHYWLGKIYSYQGQPDLAIAEYNTVINSHPTDPKMPNALLELGFAYDEAGDWEQAKMQLNKVVKLFPKTETAQKAEARLQKIKRQGL
ncbi:MAG: tol-pal system protein YbgF [Gammaproteobacteria bacterium]